MSEKTQQLRRLIEQMVKEEVRKIAPQLIREVMAGMILEGIAPKASAASAVIDNSDKRRRLQEASGADYEEYPTIRTPHRGQLGAAYAELMRDQGFAPVGGGHAPPSNSNVFHAHTEHGTQVPVSADELPDHVVHALTRDYSGVMKALQARKQNGG